MNRYDFIRKARINNPNITNWEANKMWDEAVQCLIKNPVFTENKKFKLWFDKEDLIKRNGKKKKKYETR